MKTKYVRFTDGTIALVNELTGIHHWMLVRDYFDGTPVSDAGFVYDDGGTLKVYGKSATLGLSADLKAEEELNEALRDSRLHIRPCVREGDFYATTQSGDGIVVSDVDDLYDARIVVGDF